MQGHIKGLVAALFAISLVPAPVSASTDDRDLVKFDVMTPVVEPFTGATNPIRGVPGGGLPWEIDAARGELTSNGRVEVEVEGLVLARRAPVPEERQGTNPVPSFRVLVSCLSSSAGEASIVNVSTGPAPATTTGDATIEGIVDLPSPCFAPIVFVTSPNGAWFAVTGH